MDRNKIIYQITPRGKKMLEDRKYCWGDIPPEKIEILDKLLDDLFGKKKGSE